MKTVQLQTLCRAIHTASGGITIEMRINSKLLQQPAMLVRRADNEGRFQAQNVASTSSVSRLYAQPYPFFLLFFILSLWSYQS
jgi:hypothetical protein